MIPYFEVQPISFFGHEYHLFALLVGLGVFLGNRYALWRGKRMGFSENAIAKAVMLAVVPGFFFSHIFDVIFYTPERISNEGFFTLFKFWEGLSSMGGFLGALIGMSVYYSVKKQPWWKEADIIIEALVIGWVFGRLGCTIAHDHKGVVTDFFLAVQYAGGPRHNLGLYEFLYTVFVLVPCVVFLNLKKFVAGTSVAVLSMAYAPVRFFMDFLRATDIAGADPRYFGMTAGQYLCLLLFIFGFWAQVIRKK